MDNVQKHNTCTSVPSSQTSRSYLTMVQIYTLINSYALLYPVTPGCYPKFNSHLYVTPHRPCSLVILVIIINRRVILTVYWTFERISLLTKTIIYDANGNVPTYMIGYAIHVT
jgi:hypothetical protein